MRARVLLRPTDSTVWSHIPIDYHCSMRCLLLTFPEWNTPEVQRIGKLKDSIMNTVWCWCTGTKRGKGRLDIILCVCARACACVCACVCICVFVDNPGVYVYSLHPSTPPMYWAGIVSSLCHILLMLFFSRSTPQLQSGAVTGSVLLCPMSSESLFTLLALLWLPSLVTCPA